MRILIRFSKNVEPVPINHQNYINSYIHKCLGSNNKYHDSKNDYCITSLIGGKLMEDKLNLCFENGGFIAITSKNEEFINQIISGVLKNNDLNWGMTFTNFDFVVEEFLNGWNHFTTLTPFIIKEYSDKKNYKFVTIYDDNFSEIVKNKIVNKLLKMYPKIDLTDFDVRINKHDAHKTKKIMVKNVINIANKCQIDIYCNKNVAEKIYNIGIGQSTGSCFGTIYKTENHAKYK